MGGEQKVRERKRARFRFSRTPVGMTAQKGQERTNPHKISVDVQAKGGGEECTRVSWEGGGLKGAGRAVKARGYGRCVERVEVGVEGEGDLKGGGGGRG